MTGDKLITFSDQLRDLSDIIFNLSMGRFIHDLNINSTPIAHHKNADPDKLYLPFLAGSHLYGSMEDHSDIDIVVYSSLHHDTLNAMIDDIGGEHSAANEYADPFTTSLDYKKYNVIFIRDFDLLS